MSCSISQDMPYILFPGPSASSQSPLHVGIVRLGPLICFLVWGNFFSTFEDRLFYTITFLCFGYICKICQFIWLLNKRYFWNFNFGKAAWFLILREYMNINVIFTLPLSYLSYSILEGGKNMFSWETLVSRCTQVLSNVAQNDKLKSYYPSKTMFVSFI